MRSRALALAGVLTIAAAGPAAVVAPSMAKTSAKPHSGQKCSIKKKAPAGYACAKNKAGKHVLVKLRAGMSCSHKKKAPTGFVCTKNKKGKYVLAKHK